ncbi:MAG: phosphopyruvate hydratase [Thermoprotei archaeon]
MGSIEKVRALEVLDSRSNPTVYVEVKTSTGRVGFGYAPSGASTGSREAVELRDGGSRLGGKGVRKCVSIVRERIEPALRGMDVTDQESIDHTMVELDGTPNLSVLGANTTTAVSIACSRAASLDLDMPLYVYLSRGKRCAMPTPMFNVINGGKHAGNSLAIQEFMVVPDGDTFSDALWKASQIYNALKQVLREKYGAASINLGDEGGFAPPFSKTEQALNVLVTAVEKSGFELGSDVAFAMDSAASSFRTSRGYMLDGSEISGEQLLKFYTDLCSKYPIVSVEDPFHEDDWEMFRAATNELKHIRIIGDDVFVTDPNTIRKGFGEGVADGSIIKVNQAGTLTKALEAMRVCSEAGKLAVVSHRSGETTDTFIAHLAVARTAEAIKSGAPARGERVAKYNELLRVEAEGVTFFHGLKPFKM